MRMPILVGRDIIPSYKCVLLSSSATMLTIAGITIAWSSSLADAASVIWASPVTHSVALTMVSHPKAVILVSYAVLAVHALPVLWLAVLPCIPLAHSLHVIVDSVSVLIDEVRTERSPAGIDGRSSILRIQIVGTQDAKSHRQQEAKCR